MRFRVVLFTLVTLALASSLAHAQASRGGLGAARSGGPSRAPAGSVSQGTVRGHGGGHQAQVIIQHAPRPQADHRSVGMLQSSPNRHALSWGVARTHPHHFHPPHHHFFPHSHRHFHKPRGIVIIDVPHFWGTTATTQFLPGTRWVAPPSPPSPMTDFGARSSGQLAPFDPTPADVVGRMLALAGTTNGDVVYDLGAGDGRVVIAAAQKYGAKAVGFEIDPGLVKLARENVRKAGLEKLVEIRQQDFLTADLSPATVVTLYLSPAGNEAVKPLLLRQLESGARVVSYAFDMGDWTPKITEAYRDAAGETHMLYYWEIAAPLASREHSK